MADLGFSSLANTILEAPRLGMQQEQIDTRKQLAGIALAQEDRAKREWDEKQKMLDQPFSAYAHPFYLSLDEEGQAMARKGMAQYLDNAETGMTTRRKMAPYIQQLTESPDLAKPFFQSAINKQVAILQTVNEKIAAVEGVPGKEEETKKLRSQADAITQRIASMDARVAEVTQRAEQIKVSRFSAETARMQAEEGKWVSFSNLGSLNTKTGDIRLNDQAIAVLKAKLKSDDITKYYPSMVKAAEGMKSSYLQTILRRVFGDQWDGIFGDINKRLSGVAGDTSSLRYQDLMSLLADPRVASEFPWLQNAWRNMERYTERSIAAQGDPFGAFEEGYNRYVAPMIQSTQEGKYQAFVPNIPLAPEASAAPAPAPAGGGKKVLTDSIMRSYLTKAGGDVEKAKAMAKKDGY